MARLRRLTGATDRVFIGRTQLEREEGAGLKVLYAQSEGEAEWAISRSVVEDTL
jgi:hypothetical protein